MENKEAKILYGEELGKNMKRKRWRS